MPPPQQARGEDRHPRQSVIVFRAVIYKRLVHFSHRLLLLIGQPLTLASLLLAVYFVSQPPDPGPFSWTILKRSILFFLIPSLWIIAVTCALPFLTGDRPKSRFKSFLLASLLCLSGIGLFNALAEIRHVVDKLMFVWLAGLLLLYGVGVLIQRSGKILLWFCLMIIFCALLVHYSFWLRWSDPYGWQTIVFSTGLGLVAAFAFLPAPRGRAAEDGGEALTNSAREERFLIRAAPVMLLLGIFLPGSLALSAQLPSKYLIIFVIYFLMLPILSCLHRDRQRGAFSDETIRLLRAVPPIYFLVLGAARLLDNIRALTVAFSSVAIDIFLA